MTLKEQIKLDLNLAVKSGDSSKKTALRDILSKVQMAHTAEGRDSMEQLTETEIKACIAKVDNEYRQSIEAFEKNAMHAAKVVQLKLERSWVQVYLPMKLTFNEMSDVVNNFIDGSTYVKKDLGAIIKLLLEKFPNQLDGKIIAALISKKLL